MELPSTIAARAARWRGGVRRGKAVPMAGGSQSRGGGVIIAGTVLAGAVVGTIAGQPSIGVLAGTGLGALAAIGLWARDRRR